jgi:hypothetical protein
MEGSLRNNELLEALNMVFAKRFERPVLKAFTKQLRSSYGQRQLEDSRRRVQLK